MKNIFAVLCLVFILFSCEKNSLTEAISTVKSTDSLLTRASRQIKSVDSLRKSITDSNSVTQKVLLPELNKQKKNLDSALKSGNYSIDSLAKQAEKIASQIKSGAAMTKTLDSATDAINKGSDPLDVLTQAAGKILKQSKKETSSAVEPKPEAVRKTEPLGGTPLRKSAKLEIEVKDLANATALLKQEIRNEDGILNSEKQDHTEDIRTGVFQIKIPLQNFERFVDNVSADLGSTSLKTVEREGEEELPFRSGDVTLTLLQKGNSNSGVAQNHDNQNKTEDSDSQKSLFKTILPFLPLFALLAILLALVTRRNKRRNETIQPTAEAQEDVAPVPMDTAQPTDESKPGPQSSDDDDYTRFMPKK